MALVLFYGLAKGFREVIKKKSLEKNTIIEVLFFYTLISFLMVTPDVENAWGITWEQCGFTALKSLIIFMAWLFSFKAIQQLPISYYGILDLSRVLFATLLGVLILGEVMSYYQIAGLAMVMLGLLLLRFRGNSHRETDQERVEGKYVVMAFASSILNAVSGFMDKILMREMNSSQLQFWYMLFLVLFYAIYILVTRTRIRFGKLIRNYWIYALSLLFVLADRALFIANGMESSRITVMTLIKQSGCIVTILAGRVLYKEKNIAYKSFCAAVIIAGIVIAVI
ncbi:MAG: EamA family transporter [Lachnospiraceae bacterium]